MKIVYYVMFDQNGEPILAQSLRTPNQVKEGFRHGDFYVPSWAICETKEIGIKRFNATRVELGLTT